MKFFTYAYAISTSHIKEKVNVFNVRNLAVQQDQFVIQIVALNLDMNNGVKWHNMKHRALN